MIHTVCFPFRLSPHHDWEFWISGYHNQLYGLTSVGDTSGRQTESLWRRSDSIVGSISISISTVLKADLCTWGCYGIYRKYSINLKISIYKKIICKYGSIRHQKLGHVIRICDTYHYDSVWSETAKLKLSCLTLHTRLCGSIVCITAVTFVLCGVPLRPHSVQHSPHTHGAHRPTLMYTDLFQNIMNANWISNHYSSPSTLIFEQSNRRGWDGQDYSMHGVDEKCT
jgi:hypothetical protein